jgi:hypothetical protein
MWAYQHETRFEGGVDPRFVKLRGKVLCSQRPLFSRGCQSFCVVNEAHLHNEDIGGEDIQIQITSNPSGLPARL